MEERLKPRPARHMNYDEKALLIERIQLAENEISNMYRGLIPLWDDTLGWDKDNKLRNYLFQAQADLRGAWEIIEGANNGN